MITTLTGNSNLALRQRLHKLMSEFVKKHGELALEKLDAEEVELPKIIEAVQSLPFLSERKMVILQGLGANKSASDQIEKIINSTGEHIDLVIVEPAPDKRTTYFKSLQKRTQTESFDQLEAHSLPKWLAEQAKDLQGSISLSVATYLVDRVGPDQQLLASELAKLITYDSTVTTETIDLLTEPTPQTKIFDLLDAAFAGNKAKTLRIYAEQRAQKVEPQMIMGMIAWQLRSLTVAKLGAEKQPGNLASDFGINPYVLGKSARLAAQIPMPKLRSLVSEALDYDYRSKTTTLDLDEALKTYLISI